MSQLIVYQCFNTLKYHENITLLSRVIFVICSSEFSITFVVPNMSKSFFLFVSYASGLRVSYDQYYVKLGWVFERGQKVYTPLVKKRRQCHAWRSKKLIFFKLLVYVEYTIFILHAGK